MQYCPILYKQIANFRINKMVEVSNRHGRKSTIHITNILNLSWEQLQLLVAGGTNKFGKQVALYEQLTKVNAPEVMRGKELPEDVQDEIEKFIQIFESQQFSYHHEVCQFISMNNWWSEFPNLRSINEHVNASGVKGIEPKYFAMVCSILNLNEFHGSKLVSSAKY